MMKCNKSGKAKKKTMAIQMTLRLRRKLKLGPANKEIVMVMNLTVHKMVPRSPTTKKIKSPKSNSPRQRERTTTLFGKHQRKIRKTRSSRKVGRKEDTKRPSKILISSIAKLKRDRSRQC